MRARTPGPGGARGGRARWVAAVVLAAVVTAACTSGDDAGLADDGAAMPAPEAPDLDAPAEDARGPAVGGEGAPAPMPVSPVLGRRVIRTAELVLEVDDGAAAADEVKAIATRAGGFVATTDLARDAQGVVSGTIVIRVPSDALLGTVEQLDALAVAVPVSRIDEVDVTAEATDLAAQLTNLEAYERELRGLLADVREVSSRADDLLAVFERIRSVRAEIDRIQARLDVLSDQVALSTVTVTLRPTARAVPVSDPTWQPGATLREAMGAASRGLTTIADGLIWAVVAVLPVVLVLALPVVVVGLAVRAGLRSRRRAAAAALANAPPPRTDGGGHA